MCWGTGKPISAVMGQSSPYCEDMWRRYCCLGLTSFFPIVDVPIVAKIPPDKVVQWCADGEYLRSPYGIDQAIWCHYIFAMWFLSFFFFLLFYSSPILRGRRLNVYYTSTKTTHDVALVRMSEMCCKRIDGNTGRKMTQKNRHLRSCAPSHNFVGLYLLRN